ncbi:MAG: DUF808 domain-containing protein [Gemmatimonadaceae bacterium]|nr:DUF808 domain-containing protein [Gemmatimonadaceae bacterium]
MATSLLALLDDLASLLDDVAVLSRVAARKTAGVVGDDLALNANQVVGLQPSRELPVIWAVAKGALLNKVILVPIALVISAVAPWAITPLLMIGGVVLCFEGVEKLVHRGDDEATREAKVRALQEPAPAVDLVALERDKIKGAIRTDFILSAEIVVIALGTMATAALPARIAALAAIGVGMTVLVYGAVALLVKVDDVGLRMLETARRERAGASSARARTGVFLLRAMPVLMKTLSFAGTTAMFLVGGGIIAHGIPVLGHGIEGVVAPIGGVLATLVSTLLEGLVGIVAGALVVALVAGGRRVLRGGGASPEAAGAGR